MYIVRFLAVRGSTVVAISDAFDFLSPREYQMALEHNFYMNYMCCHSCFFCFDLQYHLTKSSAQTFLTWVESLWGEADEASVDFVPFLHAEQVEVLQPPFEVALLSFAALYVHHGFV